MSNYIPVLSIRHKRLITYCLPTERGRTKSGSIGNKFNEVQQQAYKLGTLSTGAKKRLKKALELLIDISPKREFKHPLTNRYHKFSITFVTLTLSAPQQDYSDSTITKELLEPFLRIMRNKFKCNSYVWRAEKQKNGNIHYHITTNQFIDYLQLRDEWNKVQSKLNFIDRFEQEHGHRNPNSTDIHSVRHVKDLAAYMVKYMSKDTPEHLQVTCKLWDCSKNLKTKSYPDIIVDSATDQVIREIKRFKKVRTYIGERFEVYSCKGFDIRRLLPESLREIAYRFLNEVAGFNLYKVSSV